ncbi:hypothetical protein AIGOOFII_3373 [Methylobacterium marchantiae]|nr:hypothetical protein AIGOOFII_3373 [Methylobacterium marchantiae]
MVFSCPRNTLLTVGFVTSDSGQSAIVRPSRARHAAFRRSRAAPVYATGDETHELRGKGQEVTWTDESKHPVVCTEQKATD